MDIGVFNQPSAIVKVSEAQNVDLCMQYARINYHPYFSTYDVIKQFHKLQLHKPLTDKIKATLDKFGYAIVDNLPVDIEICETPITANFEPKNKKTMISENSLLFLSASLGTVYSYDHEKKGELIHNIYPTISGKSIQSNEGSEADLELHTEIAVSDNNPDYLILLCLKSGQHDKAYTTISDFMHVKKSLTQDEYKVLMQERYSIRPPYSFVGSITYEKKALIKYIQGRWKLAFNFNHQITKALDVYAEKIFLKVKNILKNYQIAVHLTQGQALILNNNRVLHGRTKFNANFDGSDRWLLRSYIRALDDLSVDFGSGEKEIEENFSH